MAKRKFDDIPVGTRYGEWTVIGAHIENKIRFCTLRCSCNDKTVKEARIDGLYNGVVKKDCGCMIWRRCIGNRYGKLTVLGLSRIYMRDNIHKDYELDCICDCGKKIKTSRNALISGLTTSCGCARYKKLKENQFDLSSNSYGIGYDSRGNSFLFDIDKYDLLKSRYWYMTDGGYFISTSYGEKIRMHRFLLGLSNDDNIIVDHINNERNDNRLCNLRKCDSLQNSFNSVLRSDNKTGYTGVFRNYKTNKYNVSINFNKTKIHLGTFDNFDDAVKARKEAEKKYFGEFAYNPDAPRIEVL